VSVGQRCGTTYIYMYMSLGFKRLMDAIPLCDIIKAYTDIYVNTQQFFNATLFCAWRHVSAAHTAIFRPAYNGTGLFCVHNMGSHTVYI